jgi:exonuclease III
MNGNGNTATTADEAMDTALAQTITDDGGSPLDLRSGSSEPLQNGLPNELTSSSNSDTAKSLIKRLCLWPRMFTNLTDWLALAKQAIGPRLSKAIEKVMKIRYKKFPLRLDIYVRADLSEEVYDALVNKCDRLAIARMLWHRPWHERAHTTTGETESLDSPHPHVNDQGGGCSSSSSCSRFRLRLCTLNINGIKAKKDELRHWLQQRRVDVSMVQETKRRSNGWIMNLPGYFGIEYPKTESQKYGGLVTNGLGMWYRKGLHAVPVGGADQSELSGFATFVRFVLPDGKTHLLVGTVYVPPNGVKVQKKDKWMDRRTLVMNFVKRRLVKLRSKYPEDIVVVGGDWNMGTQQLDGWLLKLQLGMSRVRTHGSSVTWHGLKSWTSIDHFIVTTVHSSLVYKNMVDRGWDNSDHWPVILNLSIPLTGVQGEEESRCGGVETMVGGVDPNSNDGEPWIVNHKCGGRLHLVRERLGSKKAEIVNHNRFAALADLLEGTHSGTDGDVHRDGNLGVQTGVVGDPVQGGGPEHTDEPIDMDMLSSADARVEAWFEASRRVAHDCGVVVAKTATKFHERLNGAAERAVAERRVLGMRITRMQEKNYRNGVPLDDKLGALVLEYKEVRKKARKMILDCREKAWTRYVTKGAELWRQHKPRLAWRWIRRTMGDPRSLLTTIQPMRKLDDASRLMLGTGDIKEVWAQHYGRLADEAAADRQIEQWKQRAVQLLPRQEDLTGSGTTMNEIPSWGEINDVLRSLSGSKAAGLSGLGPDWFKLAQEPAVEAGSTPKTALGRCIWLLVRDLWSAETIPQVLSRAEVVSIHKSGDRTVADNYRGISLIEILLKVVSTVVIRRISRALERNKRLSPAQAGFRPTEESQSQVVGLYEICRRRSLQGKKTYLAFIDVKKAFDTVPHGAMLGKLEQMGIRAECLRFISKLYDDSLLQVNCGGGIHTRDIKLNRGVRQGCPCSPTLFNVFINDILDKCTPYGVHVHYSGMGTETRNGEHSMQLVGLLFADDLVLICPSRRKLRKALKRLGTWADTWKMRFGAAKCGVMCVSSDNDNESIRNETWVLQGEAIPVVKEYKYLGLPFRNDLDLDRVTESRAAKTGAALHSALNMIGCRTIPVGLKLLIFKALVIPVATFGGELTGMSRVRLESVQRIINQGLRKIAGRSMKSKLGCPFVLGRELGVAPLEAITAGKRARAWAKYKNGATIVAQLLETKPGVRKRTWLSNTEQWLRCRGPRPNQVGFIGPTRKGELPPAAPHVWADATQECRWQSILDVGIRMNPKTGKPRRAILGRYVSSGYEATRGYLKHSIRYPTLARGITALLQVRTETFWTARHAAMANLIPTKYRQMCPWCKRNDPETVAHMLVRCKAWKGDRKRMLCQAAGLLTNLFWDIVKHDPNKAATLLLGGERDGLRIPNWDGTGAVDTNTSHDPTEGGATQADGQQPFYKVVALYLQEVMRQRIRLMTLGVAQNQGS